jgi:hypothetical protein
MELPSSSDRWEAESHHAWAALHPWSDFGTPNLSLKSTMQDLFVGESATVTKSLDDDHRTLIMAVLARMLWDVRESAYEISSDLLPSHSLIPQNIDRILSILNQFTRPIKANLNYRSSRALTALVQQTQLRWISYLTVADDICDYLHLIWSGSHRSRESQERLNQWGKQNPAKVRMTTYATAQLLSIVRQYPCNSPNESYHLFHAGFCLWSMAGLLFSESIPESTNESSRRPICQLDWLGADDTPEGRTIYEWLRHGGNHVLRIQGVPDLATQQGMQQVLQETADALRRMPVWGIARNFMNAILRVLHPETTSVP